LGAHETLDCAIVGGGAAGLTATVYLARYRRRIALIDAGASRLLSIPTSHNYPGHATGMHGEDLLHRLREQAAYYGVAPVTAAVEKIDRLPAGEFLIVAGQRRWRARHVILATGVVDVAPDFPEVRRAVQAGTLRYCPVCDGYEAIGKHVAVIGRGSGGAGEALFVKHFATEVSLYSIAEDIMLDPEQSRQVQRAGIAVQRERVQGMVFDDDGRMQLHLSNGATVKFDVVYVALGTLVNSGLAQTLGADCNGKGELIVDAHQQTSVDGLYAAGDLVPGLNQIAVAMGHAAIAATAIHNRLAAA
jgi:thioredoxin reductase (NADPH)